MSSKEGRAPLVPINALRNAAIGITALARHPCLNHHEDAAHFGWPSTSSTTRFLRINRRADPVPQEQPAQTSSSCWTLTSFQGARSPLPVATMKRSSGSSHGLRKFGLLSVAFHGPSCSRTPVVDAVDSTRHVRMHRKRPLWCLPLFCLRWPCF